jgi:hypothetical protein
LGRVVDSFRAAKFEFTLCAAEPVRLPPHAGSTLRGGFGRAFRTIGCAASALGAPTCALGERCPYHYVFETPVPAASAVLDGVATAPRPFVIEPPVAPPPVYEPGVRFAVGIVLVGRAIEYLPYFIHAFEELGRFGMGRGLGRYRLETVDSVPVTGPPAPVYAAGRVALRSAFSVVTVEDVGQASADSITLRFLTPTRLRHEGRGASPTEFHVLFRNAVRRVSFLNYFHCGGELLPSVSDLIAAAHLVTTVDVRLDWHAWERFSARQHQRVPMGGFTGQVTYRGDFEPLWPWLALGAWVHVGKGATFGLGAYRIVDRTGFPRSVFAA